MGALDANTADAGPDHDTASKLAGMRGTFEHIAAFLGDTSTDMTVKNLQEFFINKVEQKCSRACFVAIEPFITELKDKLAKATSVIMNMGDLSDDLKAFWDGSLKVDLMNSLDNEAETKADTLLANMSCASLRQKLKIASLVIAWFSRWSFVVTSTAETWGAPTPELLSIMGQYVALRWEIKAWRDANGDAAQLQTINAAHTLMQARRTKLNTPWLSDSLK